MRGTLIGGKEALASLQRVKQAGLAEVARVHRDRGEMIVRKAKDLCPVAEEHGGLLRSTIRKEVSGRDVLQSIEVMAGGPELARLSKRGKDYAMEVHEDLTVHHEQGQAKFLERPFVEIGLRIPEDVEQAIDRIVSREV